MRGCDWLKIPKFSQRNRLILCSFLREMLIGEVNNALNIHNPPKVGQPGSPTKTKVASGAMEE
jgi:hypothetical protein